MSTGKWRINLATGLPDSIDVSEESLRAARKAGCDITCTRTFAYAAEYGVRTLGKLLTDPRSFFHTVPLRDAETGETVGHATCTASARMGGMIARAKGWAAHGAPINPSSLAALKERLDAATYERHFADVQPVLLPIRG